MATIKVDLNDDMVALLSQGFESVPRAILELAVIELFRRGSISAEQAASTLDLSVSGFHDHIAQVGLSATTFE
jgi:hypothetical protein